MAAQRRDGKMIEAQTEMKFSDAELEFLAEDEMVHIHAPPRTPPAPSGARAEDVLVLAC